MDNPISENILKVNDTEILTVTLNNIILKSEKFVKTQKSTIEKEKIFSNKIFSLLSTIYFAIFIQVIIIIFLSGYHIFNYRKIILDRFY